MIYYLAYNEEETTVRPLSCTPNPCGAHSTCKIVGNSQACTCLPEMRGSPPNCRPECLVHPDCSSSLTCINNKCQDPCVGSCGAFTECQVISHTPICSCQTGYTGDPFVSCIQITTTSRPILRDECDGLCGQNAVCQNGQCSCISNYQGDPYKSCRPECVSNFECPRNKACMRNRCIDPCANTCGESAICEVVNHLGVCSCPEKMAGNPFVRCSFVIDQPPEVKDPCVSACGPYSYCRVSSINTPVCTCQEGYVGTPPTCRPECILSSECSLTQSCINLKCVDPCPGACGAQAKCDVRNHSPFCSCPLHMTGKWNL